MADVHKIIDKFREMMSNEVYSEPDTPLHQNLINQIVPSLVENPDGPKVGEKMVDIGCGSGYMLDKFVEAGYNKSDMTGVTMGEVDLATVKEKGYEGYPYDMTFTDFANESFDFGIVRHCLEHSAWPYLTLMEFNRIMKTGGRMYIEMPAPGGDRKLEHWQNHYSVMGQNMWGSLMVRAGFHWKSSLLDLTITDEKTGDKYKEPYHWYMITKIKDRQDYEPADAKFLTWMANELTVWQTNKDKK